MNKNDDKYLFIGLGEILWDLFPDGKKLGGAPANFVYHAQQLGAIGIPVSCIGDDDLGRELGDQLRSLGLEQHFIATDPKHPTGTVSVELDRYGNPDYIIHRNVAWDYIPTAEFLFDLAGQADVICFGTLCQRSDVSQTTIKKFISSKKPNALIVFDINLRQRYYTKQIIKNSLYLSDVLKLNEQELSVLKKMFGLADGQKESLSQLTNMFSLSLIALTRGAQGSLLFTIEETSDFAGTPTKVIDTVGAGDSFTAALCMGLLKKQKLEKINKFANRVAANVCSQAGAMVGC